MRGLLALALAAFALSLAACGGGEDGGGVDAAPDKLAPAQTSTRDREAPLTEERKRVGRCEKAPQELVSTLRDGLRRGNVTSVYGVKAVGEFTGPRDIRRGVYFVSGKVEPGGVATWGVSADAWETGDGSIFALDQVAIAASEAGTDAGVQPGDLGLNETADEFRQSRQCATSRGT